MNISVFWRRFVWTSGLCIALMLGDFYGGATAVDVRNPHGVAVIISNRNYTVAGKVSFAHRDAHAFRRYVVDVLGFDPGNVIHLKGATQAQMVGLFGSAREARGKLWFYLDPDEGAQGIGRRGVLFG